MEFVSIFSGASGSDLGFLQAGFRQKLSVELDSCACLTHEANLSKKYGAPKPVCQPAERVLSYDLSSLKKVPVLIGGPPCQSFSNANSSLHVSMLGLDNVFTFINYVAKLRPRYFIMEEAPTFMEQRLSHVTADIQHKMCNLMYHVNVHTVNTEDYGIPQRRLRTFFLGSSHGLPVLRLPEETHWSNNCSGWAAYLSRELGTTYNPNDYLIAKSNNVKGRTILEPSYTVMASQTMAIRQGGIPMIGVEVGAGKRITMKLNQRYLTIKEAQVLQGFPVDYAFKGNSRDQLKQIGNAWSVNVALALAEEVKRCLN